MKLTLLLTLIGSNLVAANFAPKANFDDFARALARVESSNNPRAFNSKENAIGIYQVRPAYFRDAAQFDRELAKYSHRDCYNPQVAKRVIWAYFMRYEPEAMRKGDWQALAKAHNGGCGWRSKSGKVKNNLDIYWNKVNMVLTKS